MRRILFVLLFVAASRLSAAVAIDAASSSASQPGNGATSTTLAHTVTGSNTYLVCNVAIRDGTHLNGMVSGVTYNGVAMTQLGVDNYSAFSMELWGLVAPTTGTNNVVATYSASSGAKNVVLGCQSFTGVNQSTPAGTVVAGHYTGSYIPSLTLVSAIGGMTVDGTITQKLHALTVTGSGQTASYSLDGTATIHGTASYSTGAASVTMSWTTTNPDGWAAVGVPLNAVTLPTPTLTDTPPSVCITHTPTGGPTNTPTITRTPTITPPTGLCLYKHTLCGIVYWFYEPCNLGRHRHFCPPTPTPTP